MKNLFLTVFVAVFALGIQSADAQSERHNWGFGVSPGAYSFYALQGNNVFNAKAYGAGVELSAMGRLNSYLDLGLETSFARLVHPLDTAGALAADAGNYGIRQNFLSGHLGLRFRLDGGIMNPSSVFVPFAKVGVGASSYGTFKDWALYVPVGLGFHIHIPKSPITITAQSNYNPMFLLPSGTKPSGFLHHSVGITMQLGKRKAKVDNSDIIELARGDKKVADRDYDKVPDEIDQCPDIFGSVNTMGCPDTDEDGIRDTDDKCPEVAGFANLQGCMDSDYDGIIYPEDDCPNEYGETESGCPGVNGKDRDGDGIPDAEDLCPDEKGLFTARGCPDADGDGVQDALDLCPEYYGVIEYSGCPMEKEKLDELKAKVTQMRDEQNFNSRNYTARDNGKAVEDRFGNVLIVDKNGDIADKNTGKKLTTTGGYKIENGIIKDAKNKTVKVGDDGNIYTEFGDKIDTNENLFAWGGNSADPSGLGGGIRIGNPYSDANGTKLPGFPDPVRLTPEEAEYCQRLDIASLRAAIYFDYDNATVSGGSLRALDKIVEAMRRCAILELQVAGHADQDGDDNYNTELSERRAKSVLRYIMGEGVSDKRLKYNAYGEKYPSGKGKDKDRRAEIRVQRTY